MINIHFSCFLWKDIVIVFLLHLGNLVTHSSNFLFTIIIAEFSGISKQWWYYAGAWKIWRHGRLYIIQVWPVKKLSVNVHEIKILKSMYGWLAQTQPIHGYIFSIMVFCTRKASYLNVKLCEIGNLNPPNFIFVPIGMPLFMAHLVLQVACQQWWKFCLRLCFNRDLQTKR